jgi:hypothetical protein
VVNDSGFNYEDQEALYNKYSNKGPKKTEQKEASSIQ